MRGAPFNKILTVESFRTKTALFDRESCVRHLYEGLPDRSKIHTSKSLERIEHTETGVRVHLADGSIEEGDIVIGTDGVHSKCRTQMWDYASKFEPEAIPESDKSVMFTEFGGLFGVSTLEDSFGIGSAESHVVYGHDHTELLFSE